MQVNVSTSLLSVLAISEFSHTIDLKLGITLEWYENRVLYHNLKAEEALNTLTKSEVRCKGKPLTKLHTRVPSYSSWALFLRYAIFYFSHLRFSKQQFSRYLHNKYCKKVGKIWIPYIIFRNTDSDEAVTVDGDIRTLVSVTRQGDFIRSKPEIADEVMFVT